MKNILGSLILLVLFFTQMTYASEYKWSVNVNKSEAHVNEAIHLKYTCTYSDSAELYVIEFNPTVDNEKYKIEILREDEKILNGKKINEYEFVLFVKEAGEFSLSLDTLMKKTNKDSIENGMLGRDNANYEEFSIYPYKQESIHVKILPTPSSMVGVFTLNIKKDEPLIEAYEPYHLELIVSGVGDFQVFSDVQIKIDGVEIFTEKAQTEVHLSSEGYRGEWKKQFAFVSDKSFTIPAWKIEYFDLKEKKLKELHFDTLAVKVKAAKFNKKELLDTEDDSVEFNKSYLYYLLTFIAGFLVAKIKFKKKREKTQEEEAFCKRVREANSLEAISFILVTKDMKKYKEILQKIETNELNSLAKIKKLICN